MTEATLRPVGDAVVLAVGQIEVARLSPGRVDLAAPAGRPAERPQPTPSDGADLTLTGELAPGVTGTWTARRVGGQPVWELGMEVAADQHAVTLVRLDPLALALDPALGHWATEWYRSAWGDEYRPRHGTTRHDLVLDVRSGRSSHGAMPWLGLTCEQHPLAVLVTPAWSGNWRIDARNGGRITAGISPWQLSVELAPGERLRVPSVVVAVGTSMEDASLSLQRAVRDDWLPRTAVSDAMPVEWNHWWPYEDVEVTQDVIARNAAIGAGLGVEVVTVDAGWFGDADAASDWQEQRGDWTRVNTRRFPGGLAALGDALRAAGVTPGIWIEAEAVGASSRLRRERPEVLALAVDGRAPDPSYHAMTVSLDPTDPTFLGYVCLGSAAGREHVLESMSEVIRATGSRWLKLDFNIDPDAGCTRTDHGHGPGDGLLRHYLGLYQVLDAFRERHPEVLLESCSSGGMRIDLGLAKHVHGFFLSDPDYTEHHVEVRMGASRMLPPVALLHWSHSQWRGEHPAQQVDWAGLDAASFDTMLRAASTQRFGVSLRLVDLRPDLRERLREHLSTYRAEVVPLVRDGVLRALTGPPERGGLGERAPALQLSDEARDAHVLVAVLLDGRPAPAPVVVPRGLQPDRRYTVRDLATGRREEHTGADLAAHGLPLADDGAVTSWWVRLDPAYPDD